jgi:hypothetical protein
MKAPPRLASWLLASALAASHRDAVLGDLCEEFNTYIVPSRGAVRAHWWYAVQVIRSLAPLFLRSWERASVLRASVAVVGAGLLSTVPASGLLMLRAFVLQHVPLKTTAELSVEFAVLLGAVVLSTGALGVAAAIRVLNADPGER